MEKLTVGVSIKSPGTNFGSYPTDIENNTYTEISEVAPASGNVVVAAAVTVSKLKAFFMISDLPVNIARDGTSPQNWDVPANTPFFWHESLVGLTDPITNDFTQLTITNADPAVDANVHIGFLLDQD